MPTFAGVDLTQPTAEISARIEGVISLKDIVPFGPSPYLQQLRAVLSYPDQMNRPVTLGKLWWPQGATRWAVGHYLVTESQRNAINAGGNSGLASGELVIDDGSDSISPTMYALALRPLFQKPQDAAGFEKWILPQDPQGAGGDPLYLLTLVDDRYFWWQRSGAINITVGSTSWAALLGQIATALGLDITVPSFSGTYLLPTQSLLPYSNILPLLLDMVAFATGTRVVVGLDGTVSLQSAAAALSQMNTNLAAFTDSLMAGGLFSLDFQAAVGTPGMSPTDMPPLIPAALQVNFPTLDGTAPLTKTVTMANCGLSATLFDPTVSPNAGTMPIHSIQPYTGSNDAALTALATQMAFDFYSWQLGKVDAVYAGVVPWVPEGMSDATEWLSKGLANDPNAMFSTRPQRGFYYGTLPVNASVTTVEAVVTGIFNDYLLVQPFDVPTSAGLQIPAQYPVSGAGGLIGVAKPYELQQQPWDGQTVTLNGQAVTFTYTGTGTRTASGLDGSGNPITENQVIVPDYCIGDVIEIFYMPGGTGYYYGGAPIVYMDSNNAGRAFALYDGFAAIIAAIIPALPALPDTTLHVRVTPIIPIFTGGVLFSDPLTDHLQQCQQLVCDENGELLQTISQIAVTLTPGQVHLGVEFV